MNKQIKFGLGLKARRLAIAGVGLTAAMFFLTWRLSGLGPNGSPGGEDLVIKDTGGRPVYKGKSLDYWARAFPNDPEAERALQALGPQAVSCLLKDLFAPRPQEQNSASFEEYRARKGIAFLPLVRIKSLARLAIPSLVPFLTNSDPQVVSLARTALAEMGNEAVSAVPGLLGLVKDAHGNFQASFIRSLGKIGPGASAAIPDLNEALNSSDPGVRFAAAAALWKLKAPGDRVIPTLTHLAQSQIPNWSDTAKAWLDEFAVERQ